MNLEGGVGAKKKNWNELSGLIEVEGRGYLWPTR